MLKNITLSAEELAIQRAREKARKEHKSLNTLFREWLNRYIDNSNPVSEYDRFMEKANYVKPGKTFSRDERNAR